MVPHGDSEVQATKCTSKACFPTYLMRHVLNNFCCQNSQNLPPSLQESYKQGASYGSTENLNLVTDGQEVGPPWFINLSTNVCWRFSQCYIWSHRKKCRGLAVVRKLNHIDLSNFLQMFVDSTGAPSRWNYISRIRDSGRSSNNSNNTSCST